MITQKELKKLLHYNPGTGIFTWIDDRPQSRMKGKEAGWLENTKYIRIEVNGEKYQAHRLAWLYVNGRWPKYIDHINQNKSDNKWDNLREVTAQQNSKNTPLRKNNTSGITGVKWVERDSVWVATITNNYKTMAVGSFKDKFEAVCARKSAENKYGFHENHGRP